MNLAESRAEGLRRPLRLLYLITGFSVGGAERHLYDLVSRLSGERYQVAVAFFKEEAQEARSLVPDFRALGVEVVDLRMTSRWDILALWRLGRLVWRWRPDIIHAHLYRAEVLGVFIGRLLRVPGVVCTLHNTDMYRVTRPLRRLLAMAYRFADRVITVFKAEEGRLRGHYGVPASRVVTVYHGFETRDGWGSQERPGLPRSERRPVIGTVGRLAWQKAHDVLLQAFVGVRQHWPTARLILVGQEDQGLRADLKGLAARLGVDDAVEFRGYVDDVKAVLEELDLFVLSSDREGLPIALLEAMAAGKAVVATRVGGIPEVVVDGVTGLLVPPRDPDALAQAIIRLLQDPEEAQRMGERGRGRVVQEFSIGNMVERTCAVYEQIAQAKHLGV